ncbi:MAG: hypothetical protein JRN20_05185 [Nitrososphaerota archaeon]|nr:hypothetical protein [Nitrososphaerota archaeon]MDG6924014.1 hypothetical protein [Nitrososphaerota archaeon]
MKKRIEKLDTNSLDWKEAAPGMGLYVKILSQDDDTGAITRLLLLKKGFNNHHEEARLALEEGFVISGKLREGLATESPIEFGSGSYYVRTPGTVHGPAEAIEDTVLLQTVDRGANLLISPVFWQCNSCKARTVTELDTCSGCGRHR